jgi:endonuclease/exonuclease/phosphatase family metal-dependent hydrolase
MSDGPPPLEDWSASIRVLTFNLLSSNHAEWERRREVARSQLRECRPDVVALQETMAGKGHEQTIDLLGPGYHVVEHSARAADSVSALLASLWPFGATREVDLQNTVRFMAA